LGKRDINANGGGKGKILWNTTGGKKAALQGGRRGPSRTRVENVSGWGGREGGKPGLPTESSTLYKRNNFYCIEKKRKGEHIGKKKGILGSGGEEGALHSAPETKGGEAIWGGEKEKKSCLALRGKKTVDL